MYSAERVSSKTVAIFITYFTLFVGFFVSLYLLFLSFLCFFFPTYTSYSVLFLFLLFRIRVVSKVYSESCDLVFCHSCIVFKKFWVRISARKLTSCSPKDSRHSRLVQQKISRHCAPLQPQFDIHNPIPPSLSTLRNLRSWSLVRWTVRRLNIWRIVIQGVYVYITISIQRIYRRCCRSGGRYIDQVIDWTMNSRGSYPFRIKIFLMCSEWLWDPLGLAEVQGLFPEVKAIEMKLKTRPSRDKVRNEWSYASLSHKSSWRAQAQI